MREVLLPGDPCPMCGEPLVRDGRFPQAPSVLHCNLCQLTTALPGPR